MKAGDNPDGDQTALMGVCSGKQTAYWDQSTCLDSSKQHGNVVGGTLK